MTVTQHRWYLLYCLLILLPLSRQLESIATVGPNVDDVISSVVTPGIELKGFAEVWRKPGEKRGLNSC